MKIKILLLSLICFLLSPSLSAAFTDTFNTSIVEESITTLVNPGHTYYLSIHLENTKISQTVYPVSFDLPENDSFTTSNSWITFGFSSILLNNIAPVEMNFILSVPPDTPAGEYTKVVAVSDIPFVEGQSPNPPVAIGIPVIVQVTSQEIEPTPSTTPTPTPTPAPSQSETTSTINTIIASPTPTTKPPVILISDSPAHITFPGTYEPPQKTFQNKITDLFSKVEIKKVSSRYNPFSYERSFNIDAINKGNLSSSLHGYVVIKTLTGKTVATLSLNPKNITLGPEEFLVFKLKFEPDKYLVGLLKAEIIASEVNSLEEGPLEHVSHTYFLHVGTRPIIVIIVSLLSLFIILRLPQKNKQVICLRKCVLPLIIIFFSGSIGYFVYRTQTISQNPLGVSTDISITAQVKNNIGIKTVILPSEQKAIVISSFNPLGISVWSLQNTGRTALYEVAEPNNPEHQHILSKEEEGYPILILPQGF